jgi:hypothetical protein
MASWCRAIDRPPTCVSWLPMGLCVRHALQGVPLLAQGVKGMTVDQCQHAWQSCMQLTQLAKLCSVYARRPDNFHLQRFWAWARRATFALPLTGCISQWVLTRSADGSRWVFHLTAVATAVCCLLGLPLPNWRLMQVASRRTWHVRHPAADEVVAPAWLHLLLYLVASTVQR